MFDSYLKFNMSKTEMSVLYHKSALHWAFFISAGSSSVLFPQSPRSFMYFLTYHFLTEAYSDLTV